jgi:hypothetical protein
MLRHASKLFSNNSKQLYNKSYNKFLSNINRPLFPLTNLTRLYNNNANNVSISDNNDNTSLLDNLSIGQTDLTETGVVVSVGDGVAKVIGLNDVQAGEFVVFPNAAGTGVIKGIALNLETEFVSVAIFGNERLISEGDEVQRGFSLVAVPTGPALNGRVIDALGKIRNIVFLYDKLLLVVYNWGLLININLIIIIS